jgi:hypothetical protein
MEIAVFEVIFKEKCRAKWQDIGQTTPVTAALFPKKSPRCPFDRKPDGPQSRSGRFGEDTILLILPGVEPRNVQTVAQSLQWLTYSSSSHRGNITQKHVHKHFDPLQRKVRIYFKFNNFSSSNGKKIQHGLYLKQMSGGLSLFKRKVIRFIFGAKQENETWWKIYNYELYETFNESNIVNPLNAS